MNKKEEIILHQGVFQKPIGINSAIFMITGMTIGAGILGLPYVVAQVGIVPGIAMIAILGLVMLMLNFMVGEIAVRTQNNYQLPGLAGKYLGTWAKVLMSTIIVFSGVGTLLAYLIGEGESLASIFGGPPEWWAVVFWIFGSILVWRGLQTVKIVEKILSILVIGIIVGLSISILPHVEVVNLEYLNWTKIFLPYGVILFALHATPSIQEAHALLPGSQKRFRKALIIGSLIPILVYILFSLAVVGVMGKETTELASIGLGLKFGPWVGLLASVFAVFAMGTGFMGLGLALKQTMIWDWKVSSFSAVVFTITAPLVLYVLGLRNFVQILGVVGGLFLGVEAILIVLIYARAKRCGDLDASRYDLHHSRLLMAVVFSVFTFVTLASIIKFIN